MDKRKLSQIERPRVNKSLKDLARISTNVKYIVTAERRKISDKDTLIVNFFQKDGRKLEPAFRSFLQRDDYISQDLTTDKTKWKTGAIDYLTGNAWCTKCNYMASSVYDREEIIGFARKALEHLRPDKKIGEIDADRELDVLMNRYQETIKKNRLDARRAKEVAEIEKVMSRFKPLPKDYSSFVERTVFDDFNFMFYSRKGMTAYCSKCGADLKLTVDGRIKSNGDIPKHNHTIICPKCKKEVQAKSLGMSRQGLFKVAWSVYTEKSGEDIHVRYLCHQKDMSSDYRHPKVSTWENIRTVHTEAGYKDYEVRSYPMETKLHWLPFRERNSWMGGSEYDRPREVYVYKKNISRILKGTWAKYSGLKEYMDKSPNTDYSWVIDSYLNAFRKQPYIEKLVKVGLMKIADETIYGESGYRHHDLELYDERTVQGVLGLNRNQYKLLMSLPEDMRSYKSVRIMRYAGELTEEEFKFLYERQADRWDEVYEKLADMRRYTTLHKVKRYFEKQEIDSPYDYFDYIGWLEEMGYDMRNEFNLFPKSFDKAHDEKSKEYMAFNNKKKREEIRRFNRFLKKLEKDAGSVDALSLNLGGLFIRLPHEAEELNREGEVLHHCVGTYKDKVIRGETSIFFIRRVEEPDKPYYTLEWKHGIIQCRGYRNCSTTPEVNAFITVFDKKMKEYEMQKAG